MEDASSLEGFGEGESACGGRLGVWWFAELASFGVRGFLFVRLKAALRDGVKGLLVCLSEVMVAGTKGLGVEERLN